MHARRRLYRLERFRYRRLRRQAARSLGYSDPELDRYRRQYERETRKKPTLVQWDALLERLAHSRVALCGDYHTLPEAQRALVRVFEGLAEQFPRPGKRLVLALEMLRPEDDAATAQFLRGEIEEAAFLEAIAFRDRWGFAWEQYREFFRWAKQYEVPVVGINAPSRGLRERDRFAADRLGALCRRFRGRTILTVIGDFHLGAGHLPRELKRREPLLRREGHLCLVHQNLEDVYWRLRAKGPVEGGTVAQVAPDGFCLFNASPWLKLRTHMRWLDRQEEGDLHWQIAQANRVAATPEDLTRRCDEDDVWELQQALLEFLGIRLRQDPGLTVRDEARTARWLNLLAPRGAAARKRFRAWVEAQGGIAADRAGFLVLSAGKHDAMAFWASWAVHRRLSGLAIDPLAPRTGTASTMALRWRYALATLGAYLVHPAREPWQPSRKLVGMTPRLRAALQLRSSGEKLGATLYRAILDGRLGGGEVAAWFQGKRPETARLRALLRPAKNRKAA